MCFSSPSAPAPMAPPAPAPPPAAPPAVNPVMTNLYDPASPESGAAAEKGSTLKKASGTSQLTVNLDPTLTNVGTGTGTGLQINK
jgi:hypothetical protein